LNVPRGLNAHESKVKKQQKYEALQSRAAAAMSPETSSIEKGSGSEW
jgi:hypothetical protein